MNFTKVFSLFALLTLAVLSVGVVSANVLTFTPNSITQNVTAGQVVTLSFNLTHTGSSILNQTGLVWTSTASMGSFTTLPTLSQINISESLPLTAVFSVPSTASGSITATINVTSSTTSKAGLPIILNVQAPTSSNFSIAVQGTQPFAIGTNATIIVANAPSSTVNFVETGTTLFGVTFSPFSTVTQSVQAILSNLQNLKFGLNTINIQATSNSQIATANFDVKKTFCSANSPLTNLTIKSIDWSNDGAGDEDKWELLDELEIEVEINNNNNDNDVDAVVEIGLFDSSGKNVADDLTFIGESEEDEEKVEINIDEDDEATVTFRFRVPADFDAGNYRMAVKVYDDDNGENNGCKDTSNDFDNSYFQSIDMIKASDEGRFIAVGDFNVDSQITCGSTLTGQFTLFNIGEDDQDRVRVTIKNSELNINEQIELTSDLDKGEEETMTFSVQIPATATNGKKQLEFFTEYDYKNGNYREESDDSTEYSVELIGCAVNLGNSGSSNGLTGILIDSKLNSEPIVGEELVVIATITNDGNSEITFKVDAKEFDEWAKLTDISEDLVKLGAGESKEITMKFLVNEDSLGSQAFNIELSSAGKIQVQEVEVEIAEAKKFSLLNFKGNSALWVIGLINLVLIILIIVIAIRLSRK